jgi:tetratricopeptide (TPR) repeat protein
MYVQRKLDPDKLKGKPDQRVFVGGHYDAVPTLRAIAQFVKDASSTDKEFFPIIPLDYEIAVEETMSYDLEILRRCRYAIFDLTDLGAQLVEMQEAKQNKDRIRTLVVYPVRERRNEPERGRRTVLSFALPHFGYVNFAELKTSVWRFLTDIPAGRDVYPRTIHDPALDKEVRWIRVLRLRADPEEAVKHARYLLGTPRYKDCLDLVLQVVVAECECGEDKKCEDELQRARKLAGNDTDAKAEVWYYDGVTRILTSRRDLDGAKQCLLEAEKLRPTDGRILQVLGYVLAQLGNIDEALDRTRRALKDSTVSDPLVSIQAMNNLGWYLCVQVADHGGGEKVLDEALEVTRHLPEYDKVFCRRDGVWLDTRGYALYLQASMLAKKSGRKKDAKRVASEAVAMFQEASRMVPKDGDFAKNLKMARQLLRKLKGKGKS